MNKIHETYETPLPGSNGELIQLVYYPQDLYNNPNSCLLIEFSLPRMLYGNNITLVKSIEEVFEATFCAKRLLSQLPELKHIDLINAKLIRIDICYNHFVDDRVNEYIHCISNLEFPHRKRIIHPNEGVYYKSHGKISKFYDKERQSGSPKAFGILRQEITIRDHESILNVFGGNSPTVGEIQKNLLLDELNHELIILHLDDTIIGDRDLAAKTLLDYHGSKGYRYYGYLVDSEGRSIEDMMKNDGKSRCTHLRNRRMINKAGVSLAMTKNKIPLPKLEIIY